MTRIKKIELVDEAILKALVSNHMEQFHNTVSTCLGRNYLKYFYKRIIDSSYSILLGYFGDKDELQGFVGGTLATNLFFDKRHKVRILFSMFYSLLRLHLSFQNILRFILKYNKFRKCKTNVELLSLIVKPEVRNKGIGRTLVTALCDYFYKNGKEEWKVSTDIELGYHFYSKLKMEKLKEFEFAGIKTCLFGGKTKNYLEILDRVPFTTPQA